MWTVTSAKNERASSPRWRIFAWAVRLLMLLLAIWAVLIEPRWVAHREISETVPNWQGPPGLKWPSRPTGTSPSARCGAS